MNFKHSNIQLVHFTLRLATFLLFAGRAWQHLFWDAPFRALLWDQNTMESIVLFFRGGIWQEYVTSAATDRFIQTVITGFGIFYALMALVTLFIRSRYVKRFLWLYILSSVSLVFLAVLYTMEKFYHVGQFFEYTIQFLLPLFFWYTIAQGVNLFRLLLVMKIAIALTFSAHGLYATGIYPQPGVFVDMFISMLHVSEPVAIKMLFFAGILDFVVSVALFVPRLARYALLYAALWGGLTAVARTWANFYFDFPLNSLHQNLYETLFRLPHMLVPLAAIIILFQLKEFRMLHSTQ
ncbi:hypothetical protein [Mariniphaga sp.]|uniref:hypothetical protein n=1 Tax=Mariniphaga sp. TaxID=1954475 RepID=UPI003564D009